MLLYIDSMALAHLHDGFSADEVTVINMWSKLDEYGWTRSILKLTKAQQIENRVNNFYEILYSNFMVCCTSILNWNFANEKAHRIIYLWNSQAFIMHSKLSICTWARWSVSENSTSTFPSQILHEMQHDICDLLYLPDYFMSIFSFLWQSGAPMCMVLKYRRHKVRL